MKGPRRTGVSGMSAGYQTTTRAVPPSAGSVKDSARMPTSAVAPPDQKAAIPAISNHPIRSTATSHRSKKGFDDGGSRIPRSQGL
ncbi:hypothetical protein GCM10022293_25490 [Azospirillum formosense]